jgi:hypothetical protein
VLNNTECRPAIFLDEDSLWMSWCNACGWSLTFRTTEEAQSAVEKHRSERLFNKNEQQDPRWVQLKLLFSDEA